MKFRALDVKEKEVKEGDKIIDFRGDEHKFLGVSSSGRKVLVEAPGFTFPREFFPSVFHLHIEEVEG